MSETDSFIKRFASLVTIPVRAAETEAWFGPARKSGGGGGGPKVPVAY